MIKDKFIKAYMEVAKTFANLSSAKRLHVGAIIVKDDRIISIGYNGMPSGWTNECEHVTYDDLGDTQMKSKAEVLHAETNAIAKLARSPESGEGATIFITHAPCLNCAKLIYQSGIKEVYYDVEYRSTEGLKFLEKSQISCFKVS